MNDYVIVTDSSSDLTPELQKEYGIEVVQLYVCFEGGESVKDSEIDKKTVYTMLREKKTLRTSASSVGDFLDVYEKILSEGNDILYIGFSSGLSSTYRAGENAAIEMREKYPDRKIYTVDTLCASLGEGLIVKLATDKKKSGATIEEARDFVIETAPHLCHWFTIDDLFFLKRGGRVSGTTALVGSMLGIKPILHMDDAGHLISITKVRGRRASLTALADKMEELGVDLKNQDIFISHGDCTDDANFLADHIRERFGVRSVTVGYVGSVIGSHSGPGTVALFFLGKER